MILCNESCQFYFRCENKGLHSKCVYDNTEYDGLEKTSNDYGGK